MGESEFRARVNKTCAGHGLICIPCLLLPGSHSFCQARTLLYLSRRDRIAWCALPLPQAWESPSEEEGVLGLWALPSLGQWRFTTAPASGLALPCSAVCGCYSPTHSTLLAATCWWTGKGCGCLIVHNFPIFLKSCSGCQPVSLLEGEGMCRVGTCPSKGDASAPQTLAWRP